MSFINLLSGEKIDINLTGKYQCKRCGSNVYPAWHSNGKKFEASLIANGFIDHKENCYGSGK